MTGIRWLGLILLSLVLLQAGCESSEKADLSPRAGERQPTATMQPPLNPTARKLETPHYLIHSTATPAQTTEMAETVELLHQAYRDFFKADVRFKPTDGKLQLVLYRDRDEFKANNRSSPWAEAYYLAPRSHAYYAEDQANPHHWMLHEATHQLNREVAGFTRTKWMDEGLATYFGSSRLQDGVLVPGSLDLDAYPLWWLADMQLSGNLDHYLAQVKLIPLRALISGKGGPDLGRNVNTYYLGYWSLTHFLFHYQNGRYAERYRQLVLKGGSVEDFETMIGPIDQIQTQWYTHLRQLAEGAAASADPALRVPLVPSR